MEGNLKNTNKDTMEKEFADEEEFEFKNTGGQNKEDDEFDQVVGSLQDIVLESGFEKSQNEFLDKNCSTFEDKDENKMNYMNIFKEYQDKIENFIEKRLKEGKPDLNMKDFLSQVESRIDEIDPQLLDMLLSFTDFQLFKEHMLAYKSQQKAEEAKEGKNLMISGQSKTIHSEDGQKANRGVGKEVNFEKTSTQETSGKTAMKKPTTGIDAGSKVQKENIAQ